MDEKQREFEKKRLEVNAKGYKKKKNWGKVVACYEELVGLFPDNSAYKNELDNARKEKKKGEPEPKSKPKPKPEPTPESPSEPTPKSEPKPSQRPNIPIREKIMLRALICMLLFVVVVSVFAGVQYQTASQQQKQIELIQEQNTAFRATITQYETDLAARDQQIAGLHATITQRETDLAARDQDLAGLQAAITKYAASLTARDQQIAGLQTTITQHAADLAARDQQIAGLQDTLKTQEAALSQGYWLEAIHVTNAAGNDIPETVKGYVIQAKEAVTITIRYTFPPNHPIDIVWLEDDQPLPEFKKKETIEYVPQYDKELEVILFDQETRVNLSKKITFDLQ